MNPIDKVKELNKKLKTTNDPEEKEKIFKQMKIIQMFGVNSIYGGMSIHNSIFFKDTDLDKRN